MQDGPADWVTVSCGVEPGVDGESGLLKRVAAAAGDGCDDRERDGEPSWGSSSRPRQCEHLFHCRAAAHNG
jgi:hypothetical protein